jgi:hypothetical protein
MVTRSWLLAAALMASWPFAERVLVFHDKHQLAGPADGFA